MSIVLPIATIDDVTLEWVQKIIQQYLKKEIHVVDIKKKQKDTRDGFLSEIVFLDVIMKDADNISLVVKVAPVDENMRNFVIDGTLAEAEIGFYKIMSSKNFKDSLSSLNITLPLPTVLYSELLNNDFTLVMEDMTAGNIKLKSPSAGECADLQLTKHAIEAIAIMHATCYSYIEKYGVTGLGVMNKSNNQHEQNLISFFKTGVEFALDKTSISDKQFLDSLKTLLAKDDYSLFYEDSKTTLPSTIIHGDYWIGQIMYNTHVGKVSILDWQFAQLSNPVYDIVTFLAVSSEVTVYRKNLCEVISTYVMKINEQLQKLKCSIKINFDDTFSSVNKAWPRGFLLLFASLESLCENNFIPIDKLDDILKFGFEKDLY